MNHLNQMKRSKRSLLIATSGILLGIILALSQPQAIVAADRFGSRFGSRPGGYSVHGHGQYGYRHGARVGNNGYGQNRLLLYGNGPYGYGTGYGYQGGYSGWNSNYNNYSPYNSNYYNPYSTWTYSPYGVGLYRPYGY